MAQRKRPSKPSPKPEQAEKPKRGAPAYEPTVENRRMVVVMAGMGIPETQMVLAITNPKTGEPITPVTLRKHYRAELDKGQLEANAKVGASLFKNATTPTETYPGGIPVAQLFWLKCRARWQQNPERNPPPPPPQAEEGNPRDTARRMAFLLARGAAEKRTTKPTPEEGTPKQLAKVNA